MWPSPYLPLFLALCVSTKRRWFIFCTSSPVLVFLSAPSFFLPYRVPPQAHSLSLRSALWCFFRKQEESQIIPEEFQLVVPPKKALQQASGIDPQKDQNPKVLS